MTHFLFESSGFAQSQQVQQVICNTLWLIPSDFITHFRDFLGSITPSSSILPVLPGSPVAAGDNDSSESFGESESEPTESASLGGFDLWWIYGESYGESMVYQLWWSHMITISLSSFLIPDLMSLAWSLILWLLMLQVRPWVTAVIVSKGNTENPHGWTMKTHGKIIKKDFSEEDWLKTPMKNIEKLYEDSETLFSSRFLPLNLRDSSWVLSEPTEVQGWGRMMRHDCHVQNECGLCWCGNLVPKFRCKPEVLREFFLSLGTFGCPILTKKINHRRGEIVDIVTPKR